MIWELQHEERKGKPGPGAVSDRRRRFVERKYLR